MALNADLRFASSDAKFGIPAAVRGAAYGLDGLKQLVDVVGPSVAKDIMFSARRLQSDEALRIGLVNRVVDAEELEDVTVAYAETLAANAPLSIRASKFFIDQIGLERSQRDEARMDAMQQEAANSEDFKEATRSFIEKRKPVFHGPRSRSPRRAAVRIGRSSKNPDWIKQENNDGTAGGTQDHHHRGRVGYRARHCPAVPAGRCGGRDPRPVRQRSEGGRG